jgi:hypothetical protein
MQTTVNLPDALFEKSATVAASRGTTVEQLIVQAIAKEVGESAANSAGNGEVGNNEVELPVLSSKRPGTLDLSHFDFDDLLA